MSSGNQIKDRKITKKVINENHSKYEDGKNWLRHGEFTGAAQVDEKLIMGASEEELLTTNRKTKKQL
jgi:hypothetical protein